MPKKTLQRIIDAKPGGESSVLFGGGNGGGAVVVAHGHSFASLTGTATEAQVPWAFALDGSRTITGDVSLAAGKKVDGVDVSAHAANPDAHHARVTSANAEIEVDAGQVLTLGAHNILTRHSVTGGAALDVIGQSGAGVLARLTPSSDVSAGVAALLKSTAAGALSLATLTASTKVRTPLIDTASGDLALSPASGITTLSDLRANTRVRTPLVDTASGDLTLQPAGDVVLSPAGNDVVLTDAATRVLRSSNYLPGFPLAGFRIGTTGIAGQYGVQAGTGEFDELRARTFVADETRVDRGQEYITKSFGIVSESFTTPSAIDGTVYIRFEDSPHITGALFTTGDWLLFRYLDLSSGITLTSVWGQVDLYSGSTPSAGFQEWRFRLKQGGTNLAIKKGAMAVNFGASGQGYILSDAVTATAPFMQIGKWTGNPYTPANRTVLTQIGSIDGSEYGLVAGVAGFTASDVWIKVTTAGAQFNNVPIRMYNGATNTGMWSANGQLDIGFDGVSTANDRDFSVHMSGYVRIGRVTDGKPNILWNTADGALRLRNGGITRMILSTAGDFNLYNNAGEAVIVFDATGKSYFYGPMTIGAAGGIWQGTGSFAAPTTGLKIWNDNGIGRLAGYSGGVLQAGFSSNGKFTWGGGLGLLDADGLRIWGDWKGDNFQPPQGETGVSGRRIRFRYEETGGYGADIYYLHDFIAVTPADPDAAVVKLILRANKSTAAGSNIILDADSTSILGTAYGKAGSWGSGYRFSAGNWGVISDTNHLVLENDGTALLSLRRDAVDSYLRLGYGNTNDRNSYLDLHAYGTTPTTWDTRLLRALGQNGALTLQNRGTGGIALTNLGAGALTLGTNNTVRLTVQATGEVRAENGLYVNGETGGISGYVGFTNVTQGVAAGNGTIKMNGATARNSTGWLKIYVGTDIRYIPYFTTVTG